MLHGTLLRLLLDETRAYDSVICSSHAAQRALTELLLHVGEQFGASLRCALSLSRGAWMSFHWGSIPTCGDRAIAPICERSWVCRKTRRSCCSGAALHRGQGRSAAADRYLCPSAASATGFKLLLLLAGTERDGERWPAHRDRTGGSALCGSHPCRPPSPHLLMGAADVFVSPADNVQEAFGLTPVEAMASGVPQVVADWDGYRETVVEGRPALHPHSVGLVHGGFAAAVTAACARGSITWCGRSRWLSTVRSAAALVRAGDAAGAAATTGEASRARALREYAWPVVIARYEALWRELAASAGRDYRPPQPGHPYSEPPLWRAFAHYATRELRIDDTLSVSRAGRDVLLGDRMPADPASRRPVQSLHRSRCAEVARHRPQHPAGSDRVRRDGATSLRGKPGAPSCPLAPQARPAESDCDRVNFSGRSRPRSTGDANLRVMMLVGGQ